MRQLRHAGGPESGATACRWPKVAAHLEHGERCGTEAETYERIKDSLAEPHRQPGPNAIVRLRRFAEDLRQTEDADGQ